MRSFASDNNSGAHPAIMEAVAAANVGDAKGYGEDDLSHHCDAIFRDYFGPQARIHYVGTGTAANVLGLRAVTETYNSVLCSEIAHINVDECGAPEAFGGFKVVPVPSPSGKIDVQAIRPYLAGRGFVHHSQPRVVQITQSTELGTCYSPDEIKSITSFCHKEDMLVHMDGARLANAAAHLGMSFKELTTDLGVDVLSFGGTKNGMLLGEAVVFLNPELGRGFQFLRKQGMQLISKMRFITAQFVRYFQDDLWLENATHANAMARLLAEKASQIKGVTVTRPVQANAVFANIPERAIEPLLERAYFYVWNENTGEMRWMTCFNTTEQEIDEFVQAIRECVQR